MQRQTQKHLCKDKPKNIYAKNTLSVFQVHMKLQLNNNKK